MGLFRKDGVNRLCIYQTANVFIFFIFFSGVRGVGKCGLQTLNYQNFCQRMYINRGGQGSEEQEQEGVVLSGFNLGEVTKDMISKRCERVLFRKCVIPKYSGKVLFLNVLKGGLKGYYSEKVDFYYVRSMRQQDSEQRVLFCFVLFWGGVRRGGGEWEVFFEFLILEDFKVGGSGEQEWEDLILSGLLAVIAWGKVVTKSIEYRSILFRNVLKRIIPKCP